MISGRLTLFAAVALSWAALAKGRVPIGAHDHVTHHTVVTTDVVLDREHGTRDTESDGYSVVIDESTITIPMSRRLIIGDGTFVAEEPTREFIGAHDDVTHHTVVTADVVLDRERGTRDTESDGYSVVIDESTIDIPMGMQMIVGEGTFDAEEPKFGARSFTGAPTFDSNAPAHADKGAMTEGTSARGYDFTTFCSHVHCEFRPDAAGSWRTRVSHSGLEVYGNKHICKHGMHTEGKCGCECFDEAFGLDLQLSDDTFDMIDARRTESPTKSPTLPGHQFPDAVALKTGINHWVSDKASALAQYGEINTWDTSQVEDMANMFTPNAAYPGLKTFNDPIGNWDTSKVTNMWGMFAGCTDFNQPIGNWDTSKVRDMTSMFKATVFNQPIGDWDTSNVLQMCVMFANDYVFNQPIDAWDTSKVTNFNAMFSYWGQSVSQQSPANTCAGCGPVCNYPCDGIPSSICDKGAGGGIIAADGSYSGPTRKANCCTP